jgi:hypothetical protein
MPLHQAAECELARRGWKVGFSLALINVHAGADLNIDKEVLAQMAAVTDDHGVWDEPADYYDSALYHNRPDLWRMLAYRLMIGRVNRRVEQLRKGQARHATARDGS